MFGFVFVFGFGVVGFVLFLLFVGFGFGFVLFVVCFSFVCFGEFDVVGVGELFVMFVGLGVGGDCVCFNLGCEFYFYLGCCCCGS